MYKTAAQNSYFKKNMKTFFNSFKTFPGKTGETSHLTG